MKHAGAAALDQLEELLKAIRALGVLKEKGRGVFYRRSKAFLHFHEDPAGLFADVKAVDGAGFERLKVDDPAGQAALLERLTELSWRRLQSAARGSHLASASAASEAARLS